MEDETQEVVARSENGDSVIAMRDGDRSLTTRVLSAISAGYVVFRHIRDATFDGDPAERFVLKRHSRRIDHQLQKLRRAGRIAYSAGRWRIVSQ